MNVMLLQITIKFMYEPQFNLINSDHGFIGLFVFYHFVIQGA